MKLLTLIVHTDVQQELIELLRTMHQVTGFTFTHVEGHGTETEGDAFLSARDKIAGCKPGLRTDILLDDEAVDSVLQTLRDSIKRPAGQGIFFVTDAEQGGHLL